MQDKNSPAEYKRKVGETTDDSHSSLSSYELSTSRVLDEQQKSVPYLLMPLIMDFLLLTVDILQLIVDT